MSEDFKLMVPDVLVPGDNTGDVPVNIQNIPGIEFQAPGRRGTFPNLASMFGLESGPRQTTVGAPPYVNELAQEARDEIISAIDSIEDPDYFENIYNAVMTRSVSLFDKARMAVMETQIAITAMNTLEERAQEFARRIEERRRERIRKMNALRYLAAVRQLDKNPLEDYFFTNLPDPSPKMLPSIVQGDFRSAQYSVTRGHLIVTEIFEPEALARRGKGKYAIITCALAIGTDFVDTNVDRTTLNNALGDRPHLSPDWCAVKCVRIVQENEDVEEISTTMHSDIKNAMRDATRTSFKITPPPEETNADNSERDNRDNPSF